MIRSSKVTLKFANTEKRQQINLFIDEYKNVISQFIDLLWNLEKVPNLIPKEISSQISTWLSARAIQCAGKQASGIVRGTRRKQEQRLFIINKFLQEGKIEQANKLQKIYNNVKISKPNIFNICPELDERFIKQDWNNSTIFDGYITLASLGNKLKIEIPVKKHKHFNKLNEKGNLLKGIRLSKNFITFNFEISEPQSKSYGKIIGVDIGIKKTFMSSDKQHSTKNSDLHDLDNILNRLSKKKKGSNSFNKLVNLRKNYINWSINQLNLSDVQKVNIEDIKNLRFKNRTSRKLSHFVYKEIFDKLESHCVENGVRINKVPSAFTSQRCSSCGWVQKSNRYRELFKCKICKFTCDADLNGAMNISFDLPKLSKQVLLSKINKTGFYWNLISQEFIVPDSPKTNVDICLQN